MTDNSNTPDVDRKEPVFTDELPHIDFSEQPAPIGQVLEDLAPQGEKAKISDLVGQHIVIRHVRSFQGKFGPALFVIFTDDGGAIYNTVVGQRILMNKLYAVREVLPVSATIVKKSSGQGAGYYDFE